jgi:hypothetical protein
MRRWQMDKHKEKSVKFATATDLNAKRFVSFKRQTIKFLKQKANKLSRKKLKADMIEEAQG